MVGLKEPKAIKDCKTIVDFAYYHRYRYLKYQEAFRRCFKRPLKDFWDTNLTGFDVVAFDRWINPGQQKTSCFELVTKEYGQEAAEYAQKRQDQETIYSSNPGTWTVNYQGTDIPLEVK